MIFGLKVSFSSRQVEFINTNDNANRVKILKPKKKLDKLKDDSEDIYIEGFIEQYIDRHDKLEKLCLADYVSLDPKPPKKNEVDSDNDLDEESLQNIKEKDSFKMREKKKVIRFEIIVEYMMKKIIIEKSACYIYLGEMRLMN